MIFCSYLTMIFCLSCVHASFSSEGKEKEQFDCEKGYSLDCFTDTNAPSSTFSGNNDFTNAFEEEERRHNYSPNGSMIFLPHPDALSERESLYTDEIFDGRKIFPVARFLKSLPHLLCAENSENKLLSFLSIISLSAIVRDHLSEDGNDANVVACSTFVISLMRLFKNHLALRHRDLKHFRVGAQGLVWLFLLFPNCLDLNDDEFIETCALSSVAEIIMVDIIFCILDFRGKGEILTNIQMHLLLSIIPLRVADYVLPDALVFEENEFVSSLKSARNGIALFLMLRSKDDFIKIAFALYLLAQISTTDLNDSYNLFATAIALAISTIAFMLQERLPSLDF